MLAHLKPRTENVAAAWFLVQAGPLLAKLRVSSGCQSFQRVCALSIKHSSFDPSMSLKSFLTRPHLRTVKFFMSGTESTYMCLGISLRGSTLSFLHIWSRAGAQIHVPTRVCNPNIHNASSLVEGT